MKKLYNLVVILVLLAILIWLVVYAALNYEKPDDETIVNVTTEGITTIDEQKLSELTSTVTPQTPEAAEQAGLFFMREEEKLAYDVYLTLYEKWQTNTFQNIARAEQTHMEAVKTLLDQYGLTDSATGTVGSFNDPVLQQLYDDLIVAGSVSEIEALKVGAAIEEIDILDLEKFLLQTDANEIIVVYENLLKGSRNHLRAFVKRLANSGVTYAPQYLSEVDYREIISDDIERGRSR